MPLNHEVVQGIIFNSNDLEVKRLLDNHSKVAVDNYCVLKIIMENDYFTVEETDDDNLSITFKTNAGPDYYIATIYDDRVLLVNYSMDLRDFILNLTMGRLNITYYEILWNINKFFSGKLISAYLSDLVYFNKEDLRKLPSLLRRVINRQNDEIQTFLRLINNMEKL